MQVKKTIARKGKIGTTKTRSFSLPFLLYFGEKIKKWWTPLYFNLSLCFSAFQTRENSYLFSISLFFLSLSLISLQPNTV